MWQIRHESCGRPSVTWPQSTTSACCFCPVWFRHVVVFMCQRVLALWISHPAVVMSQGSAHVLQACSRTCNLRSHMSESTFAQHHMPFVSFYVGLPSSFSSPMPFFISLALFSIPPPPHGEILWTAFLTCSLLITFTLYLAHFWYPSAFFPLCFIHLKKKSSTAWSCSGLQHSRFHSQASHSPLR